MPTPFSDIYKKYSALVQDTEMLSILTDEEYEELLGIFLSKAKNVYFKSCKKDLNNVDNELKQFNEILDEQEQWIIAECMKFVWVEKQLYKEENLRDRLSTKDYQAFSKANLIEKLTTLKNDVKKNINEMTISYSFDGFEGFN